MTGSPFRSTRTSSAEREAKRAALLEAAVRMFNERGFRETSLEEVAASLGVTKPVIYHHLGNKDQVLLECVAIGLAELRQAADQSSAESGTGLDRLKAFLRRYAEIIMGKFGMCVIRTSEEALSLPARETFRARKREIDDALRAMITAARDDGSARIVDVKLTALVFAGALNWPARWFRADGEMQPRDLAEQLVETLVAGILPDGTDQGTAWADCVE